MTDLIPLVLDFESPFDSDFTLKKMPTAQYVRDERFDVLGAGVRLADRPAVWMEPEPLRAFLSSVPWDHVLLVAHNAQFDGLVLNEYYGHKPRQNACTMFMLRYLIAQGQLDPRMGSNLAEAAPLVGMTKGNLTEALANDTLGEYATDDAAICAALYDKFWPLLPEEEQGFIDLHVRMAVEPVFDLDTDALRALADADKALEGLFPLVRKDDLFAAALAALGVSPEYKTTAKGNLKLALAKNDKLMLRLQAHPDPTVRLLAETRLKSRSTINRSRAQRFIDVGAPFPVPLLYYGQHPGRASGLDKLNMANLPKVGGIRQTLLAPEGHKLVIADSAQCQVRVEAYFAEQENLLHDFREGRDPYLAFAEVRYGVPYDDLLAAYRDEEDRNEIGPTSKKRSICKAAVLALGFMQGANGFLEHCRLYNVPIDGMPEAEQVVQLYRGVYPRHVTFANACLAEVQQTGKQVLSTGQVLHYPDLRIAADDSVEWRRHKIFARSANEGWGKIWRGAACENRVMAEERNIIRWQTMQVPYRCVLMCYDESVFLARDEEIDAAAAAARKWFSTPPPWAPGIPLKGGVRVSPFYTK